MAWDDIGYLKCGHCSVEFVGTPRQKKSVKYEKKSAYCSSICRTAAVSKMFSTPVPLMGPCPTCGQKFESRRQSKIFCSMDCYAASDQFKEQREMGALKAYDTTVKNWQEYREKNTTFCLECNKEFYSRPSVKKKFCCKLCRRQYFSKRFDRWIASPERISLPNNFDEFLTQNELPCLVDGCDWSGHSLSMHMNQVHGVPADEFKRAAGFNITTGVVSGHLSTILSERKNIGVGLYESLRSSGQNQGEKRNYISLERREHARKSRLLAGAGPIRTCQNCKSSFEQSSPFGRAKFCSIVCREVEYAEKRKKGR